MSNICKALKATILSHKLLRLQELVILIGLAAPYSVSVMTQSGAGVSVWISKREPDGKFKMVVQYVNVERSADRLQQALADVEAIAKGTYKEVEPIGRTIGSNTGF